MLHAMSFDEIVANNMVILGSGETVANAILELASQLDLMGLALIFKLGAMPYDMVERSMIAFGEALTLQTKIGRAQIEKRSRELTTALIDGLKTIDGVKIWTSPEPSRRGV